MNRFQIFALAEKRLLIYNENKNNFPEYFSEKLNLFLTHNIHSFLDKYMNKQLISRKSAGIMWLVASFFYAYQYILRVMPSIMLDDIIKRFGMDAATFGQFSGIYYIGYSLVHIPIGILLDRYGPRKVIPICILLSIFGILPIVLAEYWLWPILGRAITGIGSSAAILGVFKIIRMAYGEQRFARMLSFSVTIGLLGAIYGGTPVRYMCKILTGEIVVYILAFCGILLAIASHIAIPETSSKKVEIADPNEKKSSIWSDMYSVFKNGKVMLICFSAGLMVGPLEGFADIWGPKFLTQVHNIDSAEASFITSMIFVGMCFGSPVLNFVAERFKSYLGTIIFSGILMFSIFLMLIISMLTTKVSLIIGFIMVGVCSAYQILAIYQASTYVSEHVAGITTAVANMIIMIFGYMLHGVIGLVINACGGITLDVAFSFGIAVIPLTLFLGTLGFSMVARREAKVRAKS
ncbi:MAG: MFS transporter [Puniceicoccales bacterium]|jgi:MFS family permease|nr:MFS transporter [Puniceicoccales bacterium]